jgi:hypothetical protein
VGVGETDGAGLYRWVALSFSEVYVWLEVTASLDPCHFLFFCDLSKLYGPLAPGIKILKTTLEIACFSLVFFFPSWRPRGRATWGSQAIGGGARCR